MKGSQSIRICLTTAPNGKIAKSMALRLVKEKLAACVQIIPDMHSIYCWNGKVQGGNELLLIIKSTSTKLKGLEKRLLEIHPYDTPEFLVLTPEQVNKKYARWVKDYLG